jgi:hypothetical protein
MENIDDRLVDGATVRVEIPNVYSFNGKIVGVGTDGISPLYIIECIDGFLPNETYKYKVCMMPLAYLTILE